jgi:hypothetical protein
MNNALLGPCINWENIVFRPCRPCSMSQRKIPAVGMVTAISAAVLTKEQNGLKNGESN